MTQIKLRRDTSSAFASSNPILGNGEPAYETDTKKLKIGDGTTAYTQLDYFSTGGGGSTNISATLPLKIVDGVISLEVDGQTIQIVDGKLHANLDELGNEVNTLAGDVAGVQADLLKKEDKLTASSPIIKTEEENPNAVGFTTSGTTMTTSGKYSDGNWSNNAYGIFVLNDHMAGSKDNYVDIPYQIGDIVKVPQSSGFYNVSTGAFGFINSSGEFRPVAPLYDSSDRYQSRYDEVTIEPYKMGHYLSNTNYISWGGTSSTITTKTRDNYNYCQIRDEGTSVVLITASFDSNTSLTKRVFLKTENDGVQYDKLLKSTMVRVYPKGNQREVLDRSFDTSQFGLYKGLGKLEDLAPNFETIETATNQFDVLGTTKVNDLSLALGDGLSVVDGKLTSTGLTELPIATTDTLGVIRIAKDEDFAGKAEDAAVTPAQVQDYTTAKIAEVNQRVDSLDAKNVKVTGDQAIDGLKVFRDNIESNYVYTDHVYSSNGERIFLYEDVFAIGNTRKPTILYSKGSGITLNGNTDYVLTQRRVTAGDGVAIEETTNGIKISATGGGSAPTNMVITDTAQTITGLKTFGGTDLSKILLEGSESLIGFRANADSLPTTLIGGFFDSNGKKSITIGSTDHETLSLNAKSVQDGSGNKFLTSGNVTAYVTEEFVDGTEGYRIWSNGRCEQWGRYTLDPSTGEQHLTFLKKYKDTNYLALVSKTSADASTWNVMFGLMTEWSTSGLLIKANLTGYVLRGPWYVSGILAS